MRHSLPAVPLLAFLTGCSAESKAPIPAPATTSPSLADAPQEPVPSIQTPPLPPATSSYPESEEVQAILYRARELREAGRFQEALAAAETALARDPNSPAAKALHGELVAIVTKI